MSAEERVRPAHPTPWPARPAITTRPPTSARSPTASTANPAFTGLRFQVDRIPRLAPPFAHKPANRRPAPDASCWAIALASGGRHGGDPRAPSVANAIARPEAPRGRKQSCGQRPPDARLWADPSVSLLRAPASRRVASTRRSRAVRERKASVRGTAGWRRDGAVSVGADEAAESGRVRQSARGLRALA